MVARMSTRRLVVWITFLAVFAMSARISMDTDTWWHLRAGQWIMEHGAVPQVDMFSYTRAGQSWQYPGWLVEVPMYLIYRILGPAGMNLWTAGMVTLAFAFLWRTLEGGAFLRAFVTILAVTVSGVYWAARPYLVTFVLAAVYLLILEEYRWRRSDAARRRLWWLPLLMVFWANSHGGFLVGFILWGIYAGSELIALMRNHIPHSLGTLFRISYFVSRNSNLEGDHLPATTHQSRRGIINVFHEIPNTQYSIFLVGLVMLAAVCFNPSGPIMLIYPFKTVSIGALQDYIQEWQSPDFHSLSVQPFIWLLLATLAAVGSSRRRLVFTDFLLVAVFAYLGLMAGRNIALFALTAPPVMARHLAPVLAALIRKLGYHPPTIDVVRPGQALLNRVMLALIVLAVFLKVATVLPNAVNERAFAKNLPIEAVAFLKKSERPQGRLFNSYNWGGYLLWALPEYPVFIDGRTDLYDDAIIDEWLTVMRAEPGWVQVLGHYNVDLALIETGSTLARELSEQPDWRLAHQDDLAVIYQRSR